MLRVGREKSVTVEEYMYRYHAIYLRTQTGGIPHSSRGGSSEAVDGRRFVMHIIPSHSRPNTAVLSSRRAESSTSFNPCPSNPIGAASLASHLSVHKAGIPAWLLFQPRRLFDFFPKALPEKDPRSWTPHFLDPSHSVDIPIQLTVPDAIANSMFLSHAIGAQLPSAPISHKIGVQSSALAADFSLPLFPYLPARASFEVPSLAFECSPCATTFVGVAADVHFTLILGGCGGYFVVVVVVEPVERGVAGSERAGNGLVLHHHDHPDADLIIASQQRRARNVPRACAYIWWPSSSATRSGVAVWRVASVLAVW